MINRLKALYAFEDVDDNLRHIVIYNRLIVDTTIAQKEDNFQIGIKNMITYIDDMKKSVDNLSEVLKEMI